ncbi:MAG: hypothetical protein LBV68_05275 [Spirochaetaceae bacterium]|jgi:hypothetical protein|nr:hypothetical protein [Spirochaetaceae bacterium]
MDEHKIPEKGLHYYYNRAERIEKASPQVRALYENPPHPKKTLLSSLTDSKPKAALFTVIIVMCLMILFMTYLLPENQTTLDGNSITISSIRGNDSSCFVVLKKQSNKKNAFTGIVTASVSPADNPVGNDGKAKFHNYTIVFTAAEKEEFRWKIPFDSQKLVFFLQAGTHTTSFRVKVE